MLVSRVQMQTVQAEELASDGTELGLIVQNGTVFPLVLLDHFEMKKKDLTPKQLSSVCCPTCGVSVGKHCILESGGQRSSPHVNRKLAAAESMEAKRILRPWG